MKSIVLPFSREEALRVRPLVEQAYDESRTRRWPFLSDVLARLLRGAPEEDAGIAAAAVHAMVKYDRLLGFVCGNDAPDGVGTQARFDALFAMAKNGAHVAERIERIDNAVERLGVAYSMPDWIVELVRDEQMLALMNEAAPRCLRVNTLKATRESTIEALLSEGLRVRPSTHAANGVLLEGRRSPFRTQAFARGDFEMQDEGSQIVADLVAPAPRSLVIDVCAGAGGKTLAIASLLQNKGLVVALDVSREKLMELKRRARRAGASNVQAIAVDAVHPGDALNDHLGRCKRVLVDAPCTGLGAIRRNPEARWRLQPGDVARFVAAQAALLRAAAPLVAPGGRLIYCTCSFLSIEGEGVVEEFLAAHSLFTIVTARDVLGGRRAERVATQDGRYLRTWRTGFASEGDGMDGFFAAVLRRKKPLLS